MQRGLRVCCELPPRHSRGAASSKRTLAPASRAMSAAHRAAFPPPTTSTSGMVGRVAPLMSDLGSETYHAQFAHLVYRVAGPLAPEARILGTPVRHLVDARTRRLVDVDAAYVQSADRLEGRVDTIRKHAGGEPVGG